MVLMSRCCWSIMRMVSKISLVLIKVKSSCTELAPAKRGRAGWRVQAFWPRAKILPQGQFTCPEEVKKRGSRRASALWGNGADVQVLLVDHADGI